MNFVGHLNSKTSIGMAGRDNLSVFRNLGQKPTLINLPLNHGEGENYFKNDEFSETPGQGRVNFLHFNPEQFEHFRQRHSDSFFAGNRNIGFWMWECDKLPQLWMKYQEWFDEIWTASSYCANIYNRELDVPSHVLPHLVHDPGSPSELKRDDFGIPDDRFVFMFNFDANSRVDRKNPQGLIEAFRLVKDQAPEAFLVMKARNLNMKQRAKLFDSIPSDDIMIVEHFFPREDLLAFQRCADCFVSLHKSEGFGLHIAESMLVGIPVVTTGYSGNMEFCRDNNSWLVDFDLEPAMDPFYRSTGGQWAKPDVESAAIQMLNVIRKPDMAAHKARNAQAFIRKNHSLDAISKKAKQLLEQQ